MMCKCHFPKIHTHDWLSSPRSQIMVVAQDCAFLDVYEEQQSE